MSRRFDGYVLAGLVDGQGCSRASFITDLVGVVTHAGLVPNLVPGGETVDTEFLRHLLETYTVRGTTDLLQTLAREERVAWRPVGGRENNLATVNMGSDPGAAVIERVTNAIDAVLDLEWARRGEPTDVKSPRAAVEQWFGIKDGRLEDLTDDDLRSPEIRELSTRARVTLHDSEHGDRPTIDIRDRGCGLKAEEFATTIVGLNENRKLKKFHLAGAFGQGGSTALAYSEYTIVVSRAATGLASPPSPVAFTIVRFNPGNLETDKHGLYEYVINHANGHPFTVDISEDEFESGTLVRHVAMDVGKYRGIMTAPTGSLWYLAHHYLFDPVLPFRIEERRPNSSYGQNRTTTGNHRRLSQLARASEDGYRRKADLTFRSGNVSVTWWVLPTGEKGIENYVPKSRPIVITYNGQKQGDLPRSIISKDLRLPYLENYLVVHVNCDRLDNESRRHLFPTTRESVRDTSLLDDLRRLVIETLGADPELRRLDNERKQRYIERTESAPLESIRSRLANRVRAVTMGGGHGRSPHVLPPESDSEQVRSPAIPVVDPPTYLQIASPNPRKVYSGKSFSIRFRTDADPSYFGNPDTFIPLISPPSFGQFTGAANVRDGYGIAYFKANEGLEVGTTAEVTLELRPRRARAISDTTTVEVVDLPREVGTSSGQRATPNINLIWVHEGKDFWKDHEWDDTSVAQVEASNDSIDIYVSAANRNLMRLAEKARRRGTDAETTVRNYYLEHVAFHAFLAHNSEEAENRHNNSEGQDVDPTVLDKTRAGELRRACETICGILEQMFDFVVTEAAATVEVENR